MTTRSSAGLWTIAVAGSIGLHAAIGMALYAMPVPEQKEPARTEIDIATLTAASATRLSVPDAAQAIETTDAPVIVQRPATVIGAAEGTAEPVRVGPDEAQSVRETASAEPSARNETVLEPREEAAPTSPAETATEALEARPAAAPVEITEAPDSVEALTTSEEVADTQAPSTPVQPTEVATVVSSEVPGEAVTAATVTAPAETVADTATPVAAPAEATNIAAPAAPATPQAPTAIEAARDNVASLEPATPSVVVGAEETVIAAAPVQPAPPAVVSTPQQVVTTVEAIGQTVASLESRTPAATAGGGAAVVTATPVQPTLPVVATTGPAVAASEPTAGTSQSVIAARPSPAPINVPPSSAPAAITPTAVVPSRGNGEPVAATDRIRPAEGAPSAASRVQTGSTEGDSTAPEAAVVAMVPRPDVLTSGEDGVTSGTLRVAEFLTTRRDDDCILALPTSITPLQASIQAFAATPETVDQLGAEYERLSGMKLKADTQTVSRDQCGALAFARNLAQYPNFPLRLTLDHSVIGSGEELSGVVFGLRKDTLYLMVVDDEGKAELVTAYFDQHASLMSFSAPMTLTSAPTSSVQLLIAIASDGPLRTIPKKPGLPAEEYFSRLATEIIAGNRSIAYGITSFVVR